MRSYTILIGTLLSFYIASPFPPVAAAQGPEAPEAVAPESTETPPPPPAPEPKPITTIRALKSTIKASEDELEEKQSELLAAQTVTEKEALATKIKALNEKIASLKVELESVATGVDVRQIDDEMNGRIAFDEEVKEFFRPLIQEAKRATAKPRELEQLRNAVAYHKKRRDMAIDAIDQLGDLIAKTADATIKSDLEQLAKDWESRKTEYTNQLITAEYQLGERMDNEDSLWSTLSHGVGNFFGTRGKNIFIALGGMALTFLLLRFLHRNIERFSPFRKRGNSFGARLFDVIFYGITALLTICAGLAAFYALGDWVLLGFFLILIAGFIWAGKTAIPRIGEQVKLMLNLGPVREGERIVFNGVPWGVKKLSIYSRLTNPALEGGELRLPLRDLIPLSSRPFGPKEPFFPCEKGHWLLLADGTFGKVIRQTPEWVQLVLLGSSVKTFTTSEFLAQHPQNISLGFRIQQLFGVDYAHQSIATSEIPAILERKVTAGLAQIVGADKVVNIRAEFASAGASSLDIAVLADLSGEAAPKYNQAQRAIQRICVDACNEHGWVIPFTQITIHNAPAS